MGNYKVYKVLKPFTANYGRTAPWFGKPGGAPQIDLGAGNSVQSLIDERILKDVTP
jgi:hypothetical protein